MEPIVHEILSSKIIHLQSVRDNEIAQESQLFQLIGRMQDMVTQFGIVEQQQGRWNSYENFYNNFKNFAKNESILEITVKGCQKC